MNQLTRAAFHEAGVGQATLSDDARSKRESTEGDDNLGRGDGLHLGFGVAVPVFVSGDVFGRLQRRCERWDMESRK